VICSKCATENPAEAKFCLECGQTLSRSCPNCSTALPPQAKFCFACGSTVEPVRSSEPASVGTPIESGNRTGTTSPTELRHVSVLFCDLVGFTPLAESKDPEEVRELLSGYFDLTRSVIERYGGTIQKFIGDAVMAVWGAPVAKEDDAERAVRAALELTSTVSTYGNERNTKLDARVGVVTGGAATTETKEEGMVIGDRVNTASRIQSVAPAGSCYVDDATKNATSAAIAYLDAGYHQLKGKTEPVHLHQALRVVAGVGGALKAEGLEAPFVGRDRELRLVKDLFHASAEDERAHLVSVTGIAGIGKSRLAWEFYKYIDGLSGLFLWHRGRCLSYGEGVTYWALAEMVRTRARIVEGEDAGSAADKLRSAVEEYISDPEERRWVEPRLAHLLGIEDRSARDKEDLFSAWRLFFERMSEDSPVVLSFEDMQWADSSLLDFIEYLLDWSRNHAIFVLTLSRPELAERRENWGMGRRNFTSLYLDPLSQQAMRELVTGLVPGLPDEVRDRILQRSEGVPLYAVETVRMLIDRGLVVREGASYRPSGPIEVLDIPETLQALIAARLDGLTPDERGLLQVAAVLGKTFSKESLAVLGDLDQERVEEQLRSLARKEVIALQTDPRSPDRGQYAFLQDLVRTVAYETLPKRERKEKHLAAAAYLSQASVNEEDEIVEVVASHYLEAYRLAPDASDANEVRAKAREMLVRAGERAAALAVAEGAQHYFEQAIDLADDPFERASLDERAGQMAFRGNQDEAAKEHFEAAYAALESIGATHGCARLSARIGDVEFREGQIDRAIERMESAFTVLSDEEPDADLATLAAQLGRLHLFRGAFDLAAQRLELALAVAEKLGLIEQLCEALNSKGVLLEFQGRRKEGTLLVEHALKLALEGELSGSALRAFNNLGAFLRLQDRNREAMEMLAKSLELSRRVGDRTWELINLSSEVFFLTDSGMWDEALERVSEVRQLPTQSVYHLGRMLSALFILVHQGRLDEAHEFLEAMSIGERVEDVQYRAGFGWARALLANASGDHETALKHAQGAMEARAEIGIADLKPALVELFEAALKVNRAIAEEMLFDLEQLHPGEATPVLTAQSARFRERLFPSEGGSGFSAATAIFREISLPFWIAVTLLERGEALIAQSRSAEAEPLLVEARGIFERLHARPWLERLARSASVDSISA